VSGPMGSDSVLRRMPESDERDRRPDGGPASSAASPIGPTDPDAWRVSALVVTWDSVADIATCLVSLDELTHPSLEIVVLDNASIDGTTTVVAELCAQRRRHPLRLVQAERNLGFCGAVNAGVRSTINDAVLLVNPDATLAPDALTRMLEVLITHPSCGSVQPRLRRPLVAGEAVPRIDTTGHVLTRPRLVLNRGAGQPDDGRFETPGEVFGVSGAVALHRRTMLEDVARGTGPAREYLADDLVAYFDDVELDLRARTRGWTARYAPAAVGTHARAGASRRRRRRVRTLNLANHVLVTLGGEGAGLLRDAHVIVPVWIARLLVAVARSPLAFLGAVWRLRLLPAVLRRGRADRLRALVPVAAVIEQWCTPLPRGWVRDAARRASR
jgi:GT2 family glycosyltransferase